MIDALYWLSEFGLLLDFFGVIGLFVYGLPSKVERPDAPTVFALPEHQTDFEPKKRAYARASLRAHLSLGLVLVGFLFQLIEAALRQAGLI